MKFFYRFISSILFSVSIPVRSIAGWREYLEFIHEHGIFHPNPVFAAFHVWTVMGPILYAGGQVIFENDEERNTLAYYLGRIFNGYHVPDRDLNDEIKVNIIEFMVPALCYVPKNDSLQAIDDEKLRRDVFLKKEVFQLASLSTNI